MLSRMIVQAGSSASALLSPMAAATCRCLVVDFHFELSYRTFWGANMHPLRAGGLFLYDTPNR